MNNQLTKYSTEYLNIMEAEVLNFCEFLDKIDELFYKSISIENYLSFLCDEFSIYESQYIFKLIYRPTFNLLLCALRHASKTDVFNCLNNLSHENIIKLNLQLDVLVNEYYGLMDDEHMSKLEKIVLNFDRMNLSITYNDIVENMVNRELSYTSTILNEDGNDDSQDNEDIVF